MRRARRRRATSGRGELHFGQRLREVRLELGLTQKQLAERLGVTQHAVSQLEKRGWVERRTLERYSHVLGLPVSHFLPAARPIDPRSAAIETAFQTVRQTEGVSFGARAEAELTAEVKLAFVRMYERLTGIKLLPEDLV